MYNNIALKIQSNFNMHLQPKQQKKMNPHSNSTYPTFKN